MGQPVFAACFSCDLCLEHIECHGLILAFIIYIYAFEAFQLLAVLTNEDIVGEVPQVSDRYALLRLEVQPPLEQLNACGNRCAHLPILAIGSFDQRHHRHCRTAWYTGRLGQRGAALLNVDKSQ